MQKVWSVHLQTGILDSTSQNPFKFLEIILCKMSFLQVMNNNYDSILCTVAPELLYLSTSLVFMLLEMRVICAGFFFLKQ